MRSLLSKIPAPDGSTDFWHGTRLPPVYRALKARPGNAWFVDGGNASILEAPHFSLQLVRAVGVHYPDKAVIKQEAKVLLVRERDGWTLHDESGERTLIAEEELQEAVTVARQRLEHRVAAACKEKQNGVVVLDGDIAPEGCIALQKTITTLTTNGFPLSAVLTAAGPWSAPMSGEGTTAAVKLHARSRHVFLVHGATDADLALLAYYSDDAVFPGYPGGLVLADRLARVSNEEREALRIHAKAMLRELRERVASAEAASDAHDILDSF